MKLISIILIVLAVFVLWKYPASKSIDAPSINFDTALIIDVRTPKEFSGGHVKDAVNLPIDTITEADVLKLIGKDQPVVLYCHSGGRASVVHNRMTEWGFSSVYNLKTQSGVISAMNQN